MEEDGFRLPIHSAQFTRSRRQNHWQPVRLHLLHSFLAEEPPLCLLAFEYLDNSSLPPVIDRRRMEEIFMYEPEEEDTGHAASEAASPGP